MMILKGILMIIDLLTRQVYLDQTTNLENESSTLSKHTKNLLYIISEPIAQLVRVHAKIKVSDTAAYDVELLNRCFVE